ncbi:mannose-1-phosphate guanylyltransferase/mannose-6-phosphate isomerase [Falsirhodobacter algicola]|uniref:mannose-1-phosphate guanylyltransferase n=1 Tax=Falsirhodobacter algicola TaxID=2692330 RepID=A0A8J8MQZ4_9RHOB|nr:mannose-1-phosphate guanylyltransferase/mannose-6-phosphate isomerase [Falsirhodobacter algicola]QUS35115.1 mannose-1-phosphate guanylyltransferase/mannose-6-phosphate isomerase [Falsirhodobacter algicola]
MITPVLLCGGSGTRLWPLSRRTYPKQFAALLGPDTLFQSAALRMTGPGFAAPLIVTHGDFRFIVAEQLAAIGITPGPILLEPEPRNTAPAVLAAALMLAQTDPEGLMLIAPSDHAIPDTRAFQEAIAAAVPAAASGRLVNIGIRPTHAATGYGYLELSDPAAEGVQPLRRFVEKPDAATAAVMVAGGGFLWNAGIVLASAAAVLEAFRRHAPAMIPPIAEALSNAASDLGAIRLDPAAWARAENISLDYAVMEKADNLSVLPFTAGWSDLGGWDAVWRESACDARGVATSGAATALDCDDTLLRSDNPALEVVGLGLRDVIVVAMPDAVLVADRARADEVGQAVTALRARKARQATSFPRDHRPWGWFDSLVQGPRFQVKRIVVHPGASLSLQSHHHRAEHWIVVEGTARVTIGDEVKLVSENQSVYVPLGAVHRMENVGKLPMVLIEVQTGGYLGEDDIIRYEDVYARGQVAAQ